MPRICLRYSYPLTQLKLYRVFTSFCVFIAADTQVYPVDLVLKIYSLRITSVQVFRRQCDHSGFSTMMFTPIFENSNLFHVFGLVNF